MDCTAETTLESHTTDHDMVSDVTGEGVVSDASDANELMGTCMEEAAGKWDGKNEGKSEEKNV